MNPVIVTHRIGCDAKAENSIQVSEAPVRPRDRQQIRKQTRQFLPHRNPLISRTPENNGNKRIYFKSAKSMKNNGVFKFYAFKSNLILNTALHPWLIFNSN